MPSRPKGLCVGYSGGCQTPFVRGTASLPQSPHPASTCNGSLLSHLVSLQSFASRRSPSPPPLAGGTLRVARPVPRPRGMSEVFKAPERPVAVGERSGASAWRSVFPVRCTECCAASVPSRRADCVRAQEPSVQDGDGAHLHAPACQCVVGAQILLTVEHPSGLGVPRVCRPKDWAGEASCGSVSDEHRCLRR